MFFNQHSAIMYLRLFTLLSVLVLAVRSAPASGVTEVNRTMSCCGKLKIPLVKGCMNRIIIEDTTVAEVMGPEASAVDPFEFLPDEHVMLVKDCIDFTHQSVCDEGEIWEREERVHYKLSLCDKHSSGTVDQGYDLWPGFPPHRGFAHWDISLIPGASHAANSSTHSPALQDNSIPRLKRNRDLRALYYFHFLKHPFGVSYTECINFKILRKHCLGCLSISHFELKYFRPNVLLTNILIFCKAPEYF